MNMDLEEKIARAIKDRCNRSPTGYPGDEALARSVLSCLEENGMVVVPRPAEFTREQINDILRAGLQNLANNTVPNPAFRAAAAPKQG
jgi:hypothetical protein